MLWSASSSVTFSGNARHISAVIALNFSALEKMIEPTGPSLWTLISAILLSPDVLLFFLTARSESCRYRAV
jgi:hypothetical protein